MLPTLRVPGLASPGIGAGAEDPPASASGSGSGSAGADGVARRSSVIFGPPGAHGRETSRAVVRSMPALAMEGAPDAGGAAGESDEGEDDDIDIDMEGEEEGGEEGEDGEGEEDGVSGESAESPFVPLRLDMGMAPLSLDFGAMLSGFGASDKGKGKGKGKERAQGQTQTQTFAAPQPLRAQTSVASTRTVHAGKTPQAQAGWHADYFSVRTPTGDTRTPMPPLSPAVRTVPMPPLPSPAGERPGMYKHASRSMVDILAPVSPPSPEEPLVAPEKGDGNGNGKGKAREASERGEAPAYEAPLQRASTLKRRRSMPEIMAVPPPYTMPLFPFVPGAGNMHPLAQARIAPRDDEGREALPGYSNDILLRGVMPRKMEFSAPGVQARDRKWRRVLCELEGTVFRVYRCAGEGWWERRVGAGDVASAGSAVASAGAQAAAAVKARAAAAAREGAQEGKIAGEEGRIAFGQTPGAGGSGDTGEGTTEVVIPPRSSTSSARSRASSSATTPPSPSPTEGSPPMMGPASRSRLNLGLSLLKPRSHGRSKSELPNAPKTPTTPRSSLSIPRPSFGGSSSAGASSSGSSTSGAALAPSQSNVSLSSSRSGVLSARTPATPSSSKSKYKPMSAAGTDVPEPDPTDLIRAYTLQHAESGLGNDYVKRKHVIRVRLEGEQFLLQARDVGDVVDWIEGFHSASDIALDLDERIMPKGPLFPRRRRRRRAEASGSTANAPPANTTA
ncbi:hypothetical protein B0H13DRAFT_1892487 [Mycena leptocephala]|nr:hypothetical protein B0H13DRAFT_1892487 [Mycena leptocephala]